jgi:predicted nucleotidyltransferase
VGEEEDARTPGGPEEVEALLDRLTEWAEGQPAVRALGLVGSRARDQATDSSDVDVLVLTTNPGAYLTSDDWLDVFGRASRVGEREFGPIAERRVRLQSGLEVECGIGAPSWASTAPVDSGTRRVVSDGLRILHDPDGLLADLQASVAAHRADRP